MKHSGDLWVTYMQTSHGLQHSWHNICIDMPWVRLRSTRVSCKAQSEHEPNEALRVQSGGMGLSLGVV